MAAGGVGYKLYVAPGHLIQGRHGAQLVVRRLVVCLLRVQHGSLFADALLHQRDSGGGHCSVLVAAGVVAAQWQPPDAPVEVVRALALYKRNTQKT